jgi:single-strand DNA-binding protein
MSMPRAAASPSAASQSCELAPGRNEVLLSGRLSGGPVERELDSGDVVVTFRLVVRRPARSVSARPGGHRVSVDTVDCAAWRADARRVLTRVTDGDLLAVDGALRRRFFRAGGAAVSRYEVEVARIRRIGRPPAGVAPAGAASAVNRRSP